MAQKSFESGSEWVRKLSYFNFLRKNLLLLTIALTSVIFFHSQAGADVTKTDLIEASTYVANYMEEYRVLPGSVPVGLSILSTSQYIALAASCIKDISGGIDNETYPVLSVLDPLEPYPAIQFNDDFYKAPLSKETYLEFIDNIVSYFDSNADAPDYFTFNSADIRYSAVVHYLSSILRVYDFLGFLPQSMDIKVISPKNLVPASWDTPGGYEEYTSAVTYHENSADTNLYYRHRVIDYDTYKLAKEVVGALPHYDAMESIYNWGKYETWTYWGYATNSHAPFGVGIRSAREAWSARLTTSGGHDTKMNALYRALGFPSYLFYLYYSPEAKWIFTDVHYAFGVDPPYESDGFEDRPLPSKTEDFIGEIKYISDYESINPNQAMSFNGLFVTASDVTTYGADVIVAKAKRGGFDIIILTVKTAYSDLYADPGASTPSDFSSRIKTDALAPLLLAAHANNIQVHIGFEVLSDYLSLATWANETAHPEWGQVNNDNDYDGDLSGMVSPCVDEYRVQLKSLLEGLVTGYEVDGVVLMDLRWLMWGDSALTQFGDNPLCDPYKTGPEWYKEILTDYLGDLVTTIRTADPDSRISFLASSMGKLSISDLPGGTATITRLGGQDYQQLSNLVDNFILNVGGGYYWLTEDWLDANDEFRYDFEKSVSDLTSQTSTPVSITFNLRDEWEYPPEFFNGLRNYSKDLGLDGFSLYSMVSGWGEWGPAFSESQWDKVQYINLKPLITATSSTGGRISPSGDVIVDYGADQTFSFRSSRGYQISDVLVDGVSVSLDADNTYTFTNVTANHTISVTFEIITYTITATAGTGGSISPSGDVTVDYAAEQTFTITADTEFEISDVLVDGASVSLDADDAYTFTGVTADHTISAAFEDTTPPDVIITYPQQGDTVPGDGLEFTGTARDASGVAEVRIYVYDYGLGDFTVRNELAAYDPGTEWWSFPVLSSHITLGQSARLYVRAIDNAGNGTVWNTVLVNVDDWYNTNWSNRQKIVISSNMTVGDQSDFPLLIKLTDAGNGVFANAQTDGDDIVFTLSDGITKLEHEIERYDSTAGNEGLEAWVKIPALSSSADTEIYIYYGNSAVSSQENPEGVWDSNYRGVWHLKEESAGTGNPDLYQDSTINNNDGDDYVSAVGQEGQINGGQEFDGADDYIAVPDSASLKFGTGDFTVSLWAKLDNSGANQYLINKYPGGGVPGFHISMSNTDGVFWVMEHGDTLDFSVYGTTPINDSVWHYLTYVRNSGTGVRELWVDGVQQASVIYGINDIDTTDRMIISGTYTTPSGAWTQGGLDEVRISSQKARSGGWIQTSYNNQKYYLSYTGFGTEETAWYDTIWSNRQKIVISSNMTVGDQSDFPLLIKLTDAGNGVFANAQTDGDDIVFTLSDGITKLDHEIERYDSTAGNEGLEAWVKIPALSSSVDTEIYIYYGNSTVSSQENPEGVWDSNYRGVWHLKEESAGTGNPDLYQDSTINNNDGDDYVSAVGQEGQINGGQEFDGADDYIAVPDSASLKFGVGDFTVSLWAKLDNSGANQYLINKYPGGGVPGFHISMSNTDGVFWVMEHGDTLDFSVYGTTPINDSVWHYLTYVRNSGTGVRELWVDGVQQASVIYGINDIDTTDRMIISGAYTIPSVAWTQGGLDEVRISSQKARNGNWIKTSYNNQKYYLSYTGFGTEETAPN